RAHTRKIGDETRIYRDRENEILFMDLRQVGIPFEKKFIQFSDEDIKRITGTYHQWQVEEIENVPEFCYSATLEEVAKKDFSLVPSKYIEFVNRDENIDFDEKMNALKNEFADLLKAEAQSKADLLKVFEELGYPIDL
ncbi:MAG: N-6 DNA methylase, partial [Cyclobacteriaceae bacterium]|nr:N-6 DNA methylase [Cyclobacteriaceae bacterium]